MKSDLLLLYTVLGVSIFGISLNGCNQQSDPVVTESKPVFIQSGEADDVVGGDQLCCQRCGSQEILDVMYGLPTPEAFERAQAGEFVLGGCVLMPFNKACRKCHLFIKTN